MPDLFLAAIAAFLAAPAVSGDQPGVPRVSTETVLRTLNPRHPRLIVLDVDVQRIKNLARTDPAVSRLLESVIRSAERTLNAPTVQYKLIGPRLLNESRGAVNRVYFLASAYRLTGDTRFAERARRELIAAANLPDWHPSHFLDTAEMCHAVGIGYDWLYQYLSPEDRMVIRRAIVEKGLLPGDDEKASHNWWYRVRHNWNQVCHGGLAIGALAIADEEPEVASRVIARALDCVPLAMAEYAPDGGWAEGPGYWGYATTYNVYFLAALETALGRDFGMGSLPGFRNAGNFRIHCVGPTGLTFNYADAGSQAGSATCMLWLARRFRRPIYAWHAQHYSANGPLDLFWYQPAARGPRASRYPLNAFFRGVNVVFMRSAWEDPQALFVGFKGGDNRANHSHLDLGTFVLDALGRRWALDLGADDYNLPGYFGGQRWTYYRLRTEGHNTLTFNGENQDPSAKAPIIAYRSARSQTFAVADLTAAYRKHASRVWRGISMLAGRQVLIQDEVKAASPTEVVWTMHTPAAVGISGREAELTIDGAVLACRILEPEEARFEVLPADPPPPQAQQPNVKRLVVRMRVSDNARLAVLLSVDPQRPVPAVIPLDDWVKQGHVEQVVQP
ncbi:MAG: heparinase II/III domain-containing protein [Armatimonadota bacterium]